MAEWLLRDHAAAYGLNSVSLRYYNAAGCDPEGELGERHEPETHLIPLVLAEALRVQRGGDPAQTALEVYGDDFPTPDGSCVRDYVHVDDLCSAHLRALEKLASGEVRGAEAFNLGNGAGFSVFAVIEACRRVTGVPIGYKVAPRRDGDPAELVGNPERARQLLGWQPAYPGLETIVRTAWEWMKARPATAGGPS